MALKWNWEEEEVGDSDVSNLAVPYNRQPISLHKKNRFNKKVSEGLKMNPESLFEDCQVSIERGHELWKSYFSKWETIAKYEEDIPESELFDEPSYDSKPTAKQKPKNSKILKSKKQKRNKKKRIPAEQKNDVEIIKHCKSEVVDETNNQQLENILKSVLTNILSTNKNKFEIFAVLSQTSYGSCQQPAVQLKNSLSPIKTRLVCPPRNVFLKSPPMGAFGFSLAQTSQHFPQFNANFMNSFSQQKFLLGVSGTQQTAQINLGIRTRPESAELKPLEWDFSRKSPNTVCRKINKEYFIKRSFPEMNIIQDGKRFRSLCLRKRTNSVSLSMENSNFITPERKPPERKCFSENVLQRKRTRPSEVFFDNEVEDCSSDDDQTQKRTPRIHGTYKRLNLGNVPKAPESDYDDCEIIFERVKTS